MDKQENPIANTLVVETPKSCLSNSYKYVPVDYQDCILSKLFDCVPLTHYRVVCDARCGADVQR